MLSRISGSARPYGSANVGCVMAGSNQVWRQDSADLLSRGVALLVAVAVQLALITMFSQRRERMLPHTRAMTLTLIADKPEPSSEAGKRSDELIRLPQRVLAPSRPTRASISPENAEPLELDTEAIATDAVAKIMAEENRRHLDGRKPVRIHEPTVPSVFEQPRRSPGDVEHDPASDETKVWLNVNCFTLIKPKDPTGSSLPNYSRCMFAIGEPEPRGDLFEHLREPKPLPEANPSVPAELAYPEKKE